MNHEKLNLETQYEDILIKIEKWFHTETVAEFVKDFYVWEVSEQVLAAKVAEGRKMVARVERLRHEAIEWLKGMDAPDSILEYYEDGVFEYDGKSSRTFFSWADCGKSETTIDVWYTNEYGSDGYLLDTIEVDEY